MSELAFVVLNVLAGVTAVCWADLLLPARSRGHRLIAAWGLFSVVVWILLAVTGTAGWLNIQAVMSAAVILAVLSLLQRGRVNSGAGRAPDLSVRGWPMLFAVTALGAFAAQVLVAGCFLGTQFVWDDLSYHAPVLAHWYQAGRLTLAPQAYQAYYPLTPEVFALWFALPFGTDAWVSLAGVYWLGLASLSVAVIIRSLGGRASAVLGAAMVCASSVVLGAAYTCTASDLAGPAALMAALALWVDPDRDREAVLDRRGVFAAGLLAGMAVGCKVSFVPPVAVMGMWLIWQRLRRRIETPQLVLFALGLAVTGAYWYVRNWIVTGNPLFPADLGPFEGPFHAEAQFRTKLIAWLTNEHAEPWYYLRWLAGTTWWPIGLFVCAVVGLIGAFVRLIRSGAHGRHANGTGSSLLLLVAGVILIVFPFLPFSGTADAPNDWLRPFPRYLIAPFLIGVALFGAMAGQPGRHRKILWAVAMLGLFSARPVLNMMPEYMQAPCIGSRCPVDVYFSTVAVLGIIAAWAVAWAVRGIWRLPGHRLLFGMIAAVLLMLLARATPYKQRMTAANIRDYGKPGQPVGHGWLAVEDLPAGSRIAWFGAAAYQYYPLFGRHWQHVPVRVDRQGRPWQPMHEAFRAEPDRVRWWSEWDRPPEPLDGLVPNLRRFRVDFAFVTKWKDADWPPHREVLRRSPGVVCVYTDACSEIYRIGRPATH